MATAPTFLSLVNGNPVLRNNGAQVINRFNYTKGDGIRVDWFDRTNESIELQTKGGLVLVISKQGQIIKRIG